jgi:hypothetical protein
MKNPPQKLIDLCLFASLMRLSAIALGGPAAVEQFDALLICGLRGDNWPIEDINDGKGPVREFVLEKLASFTARDSRISVSISIATWLEERGTEYTYKFLSNPQNLDTLEKTLNWVLEPLTHNYVNPLETAWLRKSPLKQSFDAVKNGATAESKSGRLNEVLAFIKAGLKKYNNSAPVADEFWNRMEDELTKQEWPFKCAQKNTLMAALKMLAEGDKKKIAKMSDELIWSSHSILEHSQDVRSAAETVFKAFAGEARTPKGLDMTGSVLRKPIFWN